MAETSNKINKMRGAFKALPVVFGSTVIDQMDYTSAANLGLFRERASTLKGLGMWFPLTFNKQFYNSTRGHRVFGITWALRRKILWVWHMSMGFGGRTLRVARVGAMF